MRDALDAVAPHTDKLICYASTAAEHPENLIDGQVRAAIVAANEWLAQPNDEWQPKPLTDVQWLKLRTAETGERLRRPVDRINFLEWMRFAERAYNIGTLTPPPA